MRFLLNSELGKPTVHGISVLHKRRKWVDCIATHVIEKMGVSRNTAQTGVVTLIQRCGSALNSNIHFHIQFLDEV